MHACCPCLVCVQDALGGLQPTDHYEDVETKRRLNNLIHVSGLIEHLTPVKARHATKAELRLVHTAEHVDNIQVCRVQVHWGTQGNASAP